MPSLPTLIVPNDTPSANLLSADELSALTAAPSESSETMQNSNERVDEGCCPFKPAQATQVISNSETDSKALMGQISDQSSAIYENLRRECQRIEENMKKAEDEVRKREEVTFILQRNEAEVSQLQAMQSMEMKQKKDAFAKLIEARADRKQTKKVQRNMMRQTKQRDRTIMLQEEASKAASRFKDLLNEKRKAFDLMIQHMESLHEKQRKQLSAAQEREISYEKMINDLQTRHLKEEVRASLNKKLQVRMNHRA